MKRSSKTEKRMPILQKNTAIDRRLIIYIQGLADDSTFMKRVYAFRSKYGIPKEGRQRWANISREMRFRLPPEYRDDLETLAEDYKIRDPYDRHLDDFVVYGKLYLLWLPDEREIIDLNVALHTDKKTDASFIIGILRENIKSHPIAILIDPYSSERDILDLIKAKYTSVIELLQKKYRDPKIKIRDVRMRSTKIRERNKFIYKNRHEPLKTIVSLVNNKYGRVLDYTYVRSIIQKEEKKLSVYA